MKYMAIAASCWWRISSLRTFSVGLLMMLALGEAAVADNQKLCLTQVTGLPNKISDNPPQWNFPDNPPNLTILNDPTNHPVDPDIDTGWFDAYRLAFQNGGMNYGTMQAIAQNNHNGIKNMLYFSFKVNSDADLDLYDGLVLAFDNQGGQNATQQYTWIVIQPFTGANGTQTSIPPTAVNPNWISVWTASSLSSGQPVWNLVATPAWINAVFVASSVPMGPKTWYVTVSIDNSDPNNGPNLPLTGLFGTLLDTVATQTGGMDQQFAFPTNLKLTDKLSATSGNPDPAKWGAATQDTNCSGVFFSSDDITNTVTTNGINPHVSSSIGWDPSQANTFSVKVHNSGASAAQQVRATFKIANFGIPASEWEVLGTNPVGGNSDSVANNPTTRKDVPAFDVNGMGNCGDISGGHEPNHNGCITFSAGAWTLGADNKAYYSQAKNQHQCVRVDLDSPSGATFINSSSWNNFDFQATASKFVSPPAFISAKYPAIGDHPQTQVFDLYVTKQSISPTNASTASAVGRRGKDRVVSRLNLFIEGCRHSGTFITIAPPRGTPSSPPPKDPPKKFENCENVGGYGYGITHTGATAVADWTFVLRDSDGKELPIVDGAYRLVVPQGTVATVVTEVQPHESVGTPTSIGKWAIFADLGAAIPHGNFSTAFDPGASFNAGLEYIANAHFSAEGIFGAHHFPGKFGIDVNAYQFTGGGKVFVNPGPNRVFARAGLGGYHFDLGTTNFGGYVGVGLLHEFNARLGLEGVYTFHTVNTPGSSSQFSTVQGGLRYVFH